MLKALALIVAISASAAGSQDPVAERAWAIERLRWGLDDQLYDYPSARFRDLRVARRDHGPDGHGYYFCGEVNARNLEGAYTGWRYISGGLIWYDDKPLPFEPVIWIERRSEIARPTDVRPSLQSDVNGMACLSTMDASLRGEDLDGEALLTY